MIERGERIEELEEALRESVRITAQREMVLVHQTEQLKLHEQQVKSPSEVTRLVYANISWICKTSIQRICLAKGSQVDYL